MSAHIDFDELKAATRLPSPRGAALRVMALCKEESPPLPELAHVISSDPALAGRIIKLANDANTSNTRPFAAVNADTLLMVGLHAIRQAAVSMRLVANPHDGPCKAFDYERYWSQAYLMAQAAQAISQLNRVAPPAEMFVCGLVNGIGRLVLSTLRPGDYATLMESVKGATPAQARQAQQDMFGLDERELMVVTLQHWGIPKLFQDALYHHENPDASGLPYEARPQRLTLTLQLAALVARACMQEAEDPALANHITQVAALLDLAPPQLEEIIKQTMDSWAAWGRPLGFKTLRYSRRRLQWTEDQAAARAESASAEVIPAAHPLHILLAGTDQAQLEAVRHFLEASGHRVTAMDNGADACRTAQRSHPQVIIADWLMPGLDGIQLCAELRRAYADKPLYFILVTPFEDERRRMQAYQAGVDEVMHAPLNTRLLAARLLAAQRITRE